MNRIHTQLTQRRPRVVALAFAAGLLALQAASMIASASTLLEGPGGGC